MIWDKITYSQRYFEFIWIEIYLKYSSVALNFQKECKLVNDSIKYSSFDCIFLVLEFRFFLVALEIGSLLLRLAENIVLHCWNGQMSIFDWVPYWVILVCNLPFSCITPRDIQVFHKTYNIKLSASETRKIITLINHSKSGKITYDEFHTYLTAWD